jgi:CRISPR-associated endonuclease/helicase Cas3
MRITTLPVYSKLADPATIPSEIVQRLPPEWQLSQHQLETFYALCDPDARVVINTAMTGDGKSLAGLLPLLTKPGHNGTLALFPTNELILDQLRSAGHTLPAWGRHADWAGALYGARLDELALTVEELKRPELLLRELNLHRLTLSNPDILPCTGARGVAARDDLRATDVRRVPYLRDSAGHRGADWTALPPDATTNPQNTVSIRHAEP